jgi:hypothetical protein
VSLALKHVRQARIGLAYYKDEYRYARILYEPSDDVIVFDMANHSKNPPILMESRVKVSCAHTTRIQFRIFSTEQLIHFLYRVGKGDGMTGWQSRGLVDTLDMSGKDFTGPVICIFAIGEGEEWCTFEDVDI